MIGKSSTDYQAKAPLINDRVQFVRDMFVSSCAFTLLAFGVVAIIPLTSRAEMASAVMIGLGFVWYGPLVALVVTVRQRHR